MKLENPAIKFLDELGSLVLNLKEAIRYTVDLRVQPKAILAEMASIGFDSLPMSLIICMITGSVLAMETAEKFAQTGADAYVGGLVAIAVVRELAPIFTCLAVGARSGTAIAAEIGNMQVTEQIAALQIMHVSPIRYLFAPKLIACVLSLPLLTILGEIAGITSGMVIAKEVSHLHYSQYMESVWLNLTVSDINASLYKAMAFGVILASICCTIGLKTKGGARDVGLATTRAAVWTVIAIIIADFFLTWILFGTTFERNF